MKTSPEIGLKWTLPICEPSYTRIREASHPFERYPCNDASHTPQGASPMFMNGRAPKPQTLILWHIASFSRFYTKYAITLLLSAIFITTPETDFNVSYFATALRQITQLCPSNAHLHAFARTEPRTKIFVSHFATGLRHIEQSRHPSANCVLLPEQNQGPKYLCLILRQVCDTLSTQSL